MPVEEVVGSIFGLIFRVMAYLFVEILWEIVCRWIGKNFLRAVTFGRYPPANDKDHCEGCVLLLGMVIFILAFVGILSVTA